MKYTKRYAVFALLFLCIVALDMSMDVLQRLPKDQMFRNLLFPFIMLDPVEKTILGVLLLLFVRKPLAALFGGLFSGGKPSGGSGGTSSAPEQPDNQ